MSIEHVQHETARADDDEAIEMLHTHEDQHLDQLSALLPTLSTDEQPEKSDELEIDARRYGLPKERFLDWYLRSVSWIRYGIETGQKTENMDNTLGINKASYRCWSTVKSNLVKYSGLCIEKYLCFRNHDLSYHKFDDAGRTAADEDASLCSVCNETGSTPEVSDFDSFEVIFTSELCNSLEERKMSNMTFS